MVQRISALSPRASYRHGQGRIGFVAWVRANLAELTGRVEPVDLLDQRFNFLPRSFRWRGDLWRVRSIVRVWEQSCDGWGSARRYFEVTCGPGSCHILFQDLRIGTWHVSL